MDSSTPLCNDSLIPDLVAIYFLNPLYKMARTHEKSLVVTLHFRQGSG